MTHPTHTEQHRAACEARYVAAMPTREQRREFLAGVEKKRGKQAADELRRAVEAIWRK